MRTLILLISWLGVIGCGPKGMSRLPAPGSPVISPDFGVAYAVPRTLPRLVHPEIFVSLAERTVHLVDRQTGFSEVYAAGVGRLRSRGGWLTPVGRFATGPDVNDVMWYFPRRMIPAYFGGYPFLRITARDRYGRHVYGLHGPIRGKPVRGYVTAGCIRLSARHIVRLYYLVRHHPSTPVTIRSAGEGAPGTRPYRFRTTR